MERRESIAGVAPETSSTATVKTINVPANRLTRLGWSRSAIPTAISSTATPSSRCNPIARVRRGVQNANTGLSTLQIQDGALGNISNLLNRLSTLATTNPS